MEWARGRGHGLGGGEAKKGEVIYILTKTCLIKKNIDCQIISRFPPKRLCCFCLHLGYPGSYLIPPYYIKDGYSWSLAEFWVV